VPDRARLLVDADEPLTTEPPAEIPARTPANRPKRYQRHGVHTLQKAVRTLGSRALPSKSTALGRALHEWRAALVADLGGEDAVSTQQLALVELAVRTKLLVDSVDAYVLAMPSPVNRQRRCLHPVVRERQSLVNQLQSILRDLGLDRRPHEVPDLRDYIASKGPSVESGVSVESAPAATDEEPGC
jgi:hypothetical protein